jgi:hypothetical protein
MASVTFGVVSHKAACFPTLSPQALNCRHGGGVMAFPANFALIPKGPLERGST